VEKHVPRSRYIAALLLAAGLALTASAALLALRLLHGTVYALPEPLIWYEYPPVEPHGLTAAISSIGDSANITGGSNLALALLDNNASLSVLPLLYVSIQTNGNYNSYLNVTSKYLVLNSTVLGDPDNAGVDLHGIIVEFGRSTLFGAYLDIYVGRLTLYQNGSLVANLLYLYRLNGYTIRSDSQACKLGTYVPGKPLNVNITATFSPSSRLANITVLLDGSKACSKTFNIDFAANTETVTTYSGSFDTATRYKLVLDDYAVRLWNSTLVAEGREDYDDDAYVIPFLALYNGSLAASPLIIPFPRDGSISAYIVSAASGVAVDASTRLDSTLYADITPSSYSCRSNGAVRPIYVLERAGYNLTNYPVEIVLNSTNFDDWSMLSPDGSDIFFTDAHGAPLRYWIASIDTAAKHAVIFVELPLLQPYSEETIYMHYGGSNPYRDLNNASIVVLFNDTLTYNSISELLGSGKWVVINESSIIAVNSTGVYTRNSNDDFVMRTSSAFKPPFILSFDLAACRNESSDWDSGVAIGWDNTTNYVAYLDDIGGVSGYTGTFMAIAEGLDSPQWSNADYINTARRDNDYTGFHTYAVIVRPNGDTFTDLNDSRSNTDDYYTSRNLVKNYGNISGYVWLVNDGDTHDNCAIYRRVAVYRLLPRTEAPYTFVMPRVEPYMGLWLLNASKNAWLGRVIITPAGAVLQPVAELSPNSSIVYGNLSAFSLYAEAPPLAACSLYSPVRYSRSSSFLLSLELPLRVEYRP